MRAAVTRGGRLVVGDVSDPEPASGHVVGRSLAAGICGSDLHALADYARFTGLMDSVGVPALDPAADCVFGHEFCAEIVEHGPDTAKTLPVGTRVCSVPILLGPAGVEQIGYSNRYPGALAQHLVRRFRAIAGQPKHGCGHALVFGPVVRPRGERAHRFVAHGLVAVINGRCHGTEGFRTARGGQHV